MSVTVQTAPLMPLADNAWVVAEQNALAKSEVIASFLLWISISLLLLTEEEETPEMVVVDLEVTVVEVVPAATEGAIVGVVEGLGEVGLLVGATVGKFCSVEQKFWLGSYWENKV